MAKTKQTMILDYTTMSDFLACRKYYYWRHRKHLAPVTKSLPSWFGHSLHQGFRALYLDADSIEAFKKDYTPESIPVKEKRTVEHGVHLLEEYAKQYIGRNPFTVIECNGSHSVKLTDDLIYAGRMDGVVKWKYNNLIYVLEHKTMAAIKQNFPEEFDLNHQIDGYIMLCKDKFGRCDGVYLDAISTAKSPTTRFNRDPVTRTIEQQKNFTKEVVDISRNIRWAIERDSFPRNTKQCSYYGACPFRQLCLYGERAIEMYQVCVWDAKEGKEVKNGN